MYSTTNVDSKNYITLEMEPEERVLMKDDVMIAYVIKFNQKLNHLICGCYIGIQYKKVLSPTSLRLAADLSLPLISSPALASTSAILVRCVEAKRTASS